VRSRTPPAPQTGYAPVNGLHYEIHSSGAARLPALRETVYVGVSVGSWVTAPLFGET
jgi:hypothetical protein